MANKKCFVTRSVSISSWLVTVTLGLTAVACNKPGEQPPSVAMPPPNISSAGSPSIPSGSSSDSPANTEGKTALLTLTCLPETLVRSADSNSSVQLFEEVGENQVVKVSHTDLLGLGKTTATDLPARNDVWGVVRHKNDPYLRAWIPTKVSPSVIRQGRIYLLSEKPHLQNDYIKLEWSDDSKKRSEEQVYVSNPVGVTIPLSKLSPAKAGSYVGGMFFYVEDPVDADEHLFEKWSSQVK